MEIVGPTSTEAVSVLRREYVASLAAPLDGMWETIISTAPQWEIRQGGERIGYACVDDERRLLQFHVAAAFEGLAAAAFAGVLQEVGARKAMVTTFEPWLARCLDRHRHVRVHTLLYHYHGPNEGARAHDTNLSLEPVRESEREMMEAFVRKCFGYDQGDWLANYLKHLVSRGELYALRNGSALLGTGELRVSETQLPYADLGVIVSPDHRGRGYAPFILATLQDRAARAGMISICSTTAENRAARRAIERAGFVAPHRLLEVHF